MPELPEVEALAEFLREHAVGRVVARVDVAAISVLKTFDPPPSALAGLEITGVARHGKFLDLDVDGLHLVIHLARAGWLRWSPQLRRDTARPGKSPLALRVVLDDGSGFDLTEAGTQQAARRLRRPRPAPRCRGSPRSGPDPLRRRVRPGGARGVARRAAARRSRGCCATSRCSPASATPTPTRCCTRPACRRSRSRPR